MKVLIVDDHVIVREGVRRLLAPFPEILIHEAASAPEAVLAVRTNRPDVVLLDLNLPNSSGLELLRRLLLEDKAANVLIFSMHAESLYVSRALNAGARGYISKNEAGRPLLTAIESLVSRTSHASHSL